MNALDEFGFIAEVGGVVDFVFKELSWLVSNVLTLGRGGRTGTYDSSDFVAEEIAWLILVIT